MKLAAPHAFSHSGSKRQTDAGLLRPEWFSMLECLTAQQVTLVPRLHSFVLRKKEKPSHVCHKQTAAVFSAPARKAPFFPIGPLDRSKPKQLHCCNIIITHPVYKYQAFGKVCQNYFCSNKIYSQHTSRQNLEREPLPSCFCPHRPSENCSA